MISFLCIDFDSISYYLHYVMKLDVLSFIILLILNICVSMNYLHFLEFEIDDNK